MTASMIDGDPVCRCYFNSKSLSVSNTCVLIGKFQWESLSLFVAVYPLEKYKFMNRIKQACYIINYKHYYINPVDTVHCICNSK